MRRAPTDPSPGGSPPPSSAPLGSSWRVDGSRASPRSWVRALWGGLAAGPGQPLLPVVRRAFLVFLLICLAITVPQWLAAPVVPVNRSWPVLPALAWLAVAAGWQYRRARSNPVVDVLSAVGVGVVVWAVGALPVGGVLFVGVAFRALYGRLPGAVVSTAMTLVAVTAGVTGAGGTLGDVKLGQYGPGLTLTSLALRLVLAAVQRYETSTAARFEAVVRSSRDVIVITDADTVAGYVSPALRTVFGLAEDALPENRLLSWVIDADRRTARDRVDRMLVEPGAATTFTCRVPVAGGECAHVEINAQNLLDDPHVHGLLFAVRDVTQRMLLTEELRHQAFHDPLTGLGNRALLADRLGEALASPGLDVALMLLDLDSFKAVNDTLGHVAGDELLIEVAARLGRHLAPDDTLARLGGDEFAVLLLGERAAPHLAEQVADRLLAAFGPPVWIAGSRRGISASIGIAVGAHPVGADQLMREADVALYRAKSGGKARHVQYRHELHKHAVEQMQLQLDLKEALARGEFVLHYQPVHELGTGAWVGVEALLRWDRPLTGMVGPADFIALAEGTGMIVPLGRWAMLEACRCAAAWQRSRERPLHVNVNVSVCQFVLGNVVGDVRDALSQSGLPPSLLTVEITESVLATDDAAVESQLNLLRQLGVRIALDDFGTGFSSLSYLTRYPVDELKIDKSFVDRIGQDGADSLPVVVAIMALSRSLNLRTVAEGIETDEQRARLTALGCDLGQGFRLSPPLTESALEALLRHGPADPVGAGADPAGSRAEGLGVNAARRGNERGEPEG